MESIEDKKYLRIKSVQKVNVKDPIKCQIQDLKKVLQFSHCFLAVEEIPDTCLLADVESNFQRVNVLKQVLMMHHIKTLD